MKSQTNRVEISLALTLILALTNLLSAPLAAAAPAANSRAVLTSDAALALEPLIERSPEPVETPVEGLDTEALQTSDWWATVQENIRQEEYHVTWQDRTHLPDLAAAYQAPNRAHNLRTYFTPEGPVVIPRVWPEGAEAPLWRWGLALTGYGYAGDVRPVGEPAQTVAKDNRFEYHYQSAIHNPQSEIIEWYINDERGLEQGFTLQTPPLPGRERGPGGEGSNLVLELALTGDLTPHLSDDNQTIEFTASAGPSSSLGLSSAEGSG